MNAPPAEPRTVCPPPPAGPRRPLTAPLALAGALLLAGCGHTASAAPAAGTLPSGGHLVIVTDNGVVLRPADGRRAAADRTVRSRWTRHGSTWVLDLACPAHPPAGAGCPRTPTVEVPAGTSVTVSARNAGVDAAGLTGSLDLTTVNGDVTVEKAGSAHATVRLTTRNGSVRATGLRAAHLGAVTVNGDVVLGCSAAPGTVDATTTNGSVGVTVPPGGPGYAVGARTTNGRTDVTLPTAAAGSPRTMTLRTVNGDVTAGAA
ncbi:DUF4097 family beta strand repeat-containing protein [Streptantibioticus silvisoli]|uniref:DUF4097 family beta strand repeat-containing protein n=1 Tax=Streptantibioticus silvisoli TaxID=2705255 RepID=A0ABT6W0V7_9ACTN|nr:DUF4097 family beta strand repeat-containing protein [Streptantibioticus silvisoli]MDI5964381.1 DUF4097 family beta strand repeat-containing protein [Streptantibioticus silvisoli]